jgi:tRNA(adenine34) deaminase
LNFGTDEYFMQQALKLAREAREKEEVPVGAIVVVNKTIVGKSHNQTEQLQDVTAHAEMLAISSAANYLGSKYLKDCTIYITLEPCIMCAGALAWSQIKRVVYGAKDDKRGGIELLKKQSPSIEVTGGILEEECAQLIKSFFKSKRK